MSSVRAARQSARQSAQKPAAYKTISFPAPTLGLLANQNLATPQPGGASVLENILPTATGGILRRGSEAYAQIESGDDIRSLFIYANGNNQSMFTATDTAIYNIAGSVFGLLIDDADNVFVDDLGNSLLGDSLEPLLTGFTSGEWTAVQFATSGGVFLDLVNGSDDKLIYDGATFYPISTENLNALNFDTQTASFTVGATLTGASSTASATIKKVIDNGATGTLWLGAITGAFTDNETITDSDGGSAKADGVSSLLWGAITGTDSPDPKNWSYNWVYKSRLFYIEKNSLNAWYLAASSLTGTATQLPLGGVFQLGGSLLFGSTWSLETGQGGLSEQCIFVTTEGEVAVYQGTDPSNASTWSKVGIYRIGKPLGPNAHFRAGGDIVIATDIGLIPLSQALQKDFAVLSPTAISAQIETIWNEEVKARSGADWNCVVWSASQMAVVAPPVVTDQPPVMYVANSRTGAWSKFTGWQANCLAVFQDRMFFGTNGGLVIEANVTGQDQGKPYTGIYMPMFSDLGAPGRKSAGVSRAVTRSVANPNEGLSMQADFAVNLPSPPNAGVVAGANAWGVGKWGEAQWGGVSVKNTYGTWKSTPQNGDVLAPALQITSGNVVPLDAEIVRIDTSFQPAEMVV